MDLDIERQIHAHTRKLHDIFNTLYYDVPMRREDPDGTWCGTPKGQPNSQWAGGDGQTPDFLNFLENVINVDLAPGFLRFLF